MSPDRRTLKACLLWCARRLVGGGVPFAGEVRVAIEAAGAGEELVVRPSAEADGLGESPPPLAETAAETDLAGHFLSAAEVAILSALAGKQPAKAKTVMALAGLDATAFYLLWGNLKARGLVVGDREEYRLAHEWLRPLLAAARPAA